MEAAILHDIDEVVVRILDLRRLRLRYSGPEFDVGPAAGHVRRDRDGTWLPRAGNDLGFALVVLRVENVVRDALALEHPRERFRHVNAHRADEYRIPELVETL